MTSLDVWTVTITFRAEQEQTRADVFLQGPAVELECSGLSEPIALRSDVTVLGEDLAAARALQDLSRCLFDRAEHDAPVDERSEHRA
jgi:uncharacterized protein DUF1876